MSNIVKALKKYGISTAKLMEKIRETEEGKVAAKLGEWAYGAFTDSERKEYVKIRAEQKEIEATLYQARQILEDMAAAKILKERID